MSDEENIYHLRQFFPSVEVSTVASTYRACHNDFEATYKNLQAKLNYNAELNALGKVSPQRKFDFLKIVFDKLVPEFIHSTLLKWNWDINGALDEILIVEERRCKDEELLRRKEEEERRKMEMERIRVIEEQKKMAEQRSNVIYLRSLFPRLPEQFIEEQLKSHNWNPDAAYPVLEEAESRREMEEVRHQKEFEEFIQMEAEQKRAIEIKEFEQNATTAVERNLDNILQCRNWDEVGKLFDEKRSNEKIDNSNVNERAFIFASVRTLPGVSAPEAKIAFENANMDIDKALLLLHAQSFQRALDNLVNTVSEVPLEKVRETLEKVYPDEQAALQLLQPDARDVADEKIVLQALNDAEELLRSVEQRFKIWNTEKAEIFSRREARRAHAENAQTDEERNFMQSVDVMQTQKEDILIDSNEKSENRKLKEIRDRRTARCAKIASMDKADISKLTEKFNLIFREEYKKLTAEQDRLTEQKQSIVAEKLRKRIGDSKFAALQAAMGRAPGGHITDSTLGVSHRYSDSRVISAIKNMSLKDDITHQTSSNKDNDSVLVSTPSNNGFDTDIPTSSEIELNYGIATSSSAPPCQYSPPRTTPEFHSSISGMYNNHSPTGIAPHAAVPYPSSYNQHDKQSSQKYQHTQPSQNFPYSSGINYSFGYLPNHVQHPTPSPPHQYQLPSTQAQSSSNFRPPNTMQSPSNPQMYYTPHLPTGHIHNPVTAFPRASFSPHPIHPPYNATSNATHNVPYNPPPNVTFYPHYNPQGHIQPSPSPGKYPGL